MPADVAALAVGFGSALRLAGVPTTPEQAARLARAIEQVGPVSLTDMYWTARVTLLTDHEQVDAFDRVFGQVFRGLVDVADDRGDRAAPAPAHSRRAPSPTRPPRPEPAAAAAITADRAASGASPGDRDDTDRDDVEAPFLAPSREERLSTTDFGALEPVELAELHRLMQELRIATPLRRGRRRRRSPTGDVLDLRTTLRRSRRTGGDPVVQVHERRRPRPRRLVVLCDISGSMAPYARAYIQFLHAATGAPRAEVFTFATRLTRMTRALTVPNPQVALDRAATAAPDWEGGTRIGEAVKAFLDGYGRRGLARGAVVVIVSDGWERDDPALLGDQMARLRRLAHRIVWVNPRTADARYQPLTGGMRAALPYCDAVVSGHTLRALDAVLTAIGA